MAIQFQDIVKSSTSGGLVGLAAYGLSLVAAHYGYTIPPDQLVTIITVLVGIVGHAHFVSLNLKQHAEQINDTVRSVAKAFPTTSYAQSDFVIDKNGVFPAKITVTTVGSGGGGNDTPAV